MLEKKLNALKNYLWAFNADFIINHSRIYNASSELIKALQEMQRQLYENANPLIMALIDDIDDLVEDAIDVDGRGHFLSYYDGIENAIDDFYIYRTN